MKKIINYFIVISALILSISCDNDDDGAVDYAEGNAHSVLLDDKISVFDVNTDLDIKVFTKPNTTLSNLEISKDQSKVADAVIEKDIASFNSSSLLPFTFKTEDGGTVSTGDFKLTATSKVSNGEIGKTPLTLSIAKAISFSEQTSSIKIGDTASTNLIIFQTFTKSAKIDDVVAQWKKGKNGTYANTDIVFNTKKDTIALKDRKYIDVYGLTSGDTLFYKFTVRSGTLIDEISTSVAIRP